MPSRPGVGNTILIALVLALSLAAVLGFIATSTQGNVLDVLGSSDESVDSTFDDQTPGLKDTIEQGIKDGLEGGEIGGGSGSSTGDSTRSAGSSGLGGSQSAGNCELDSSATFANGFDTDSDIQTFSDLHAFSNLDIISQDTYDGEGSLQVHYPGGKHRGASLSYIFSDEGMSEPEELYARYAVRFGSDWEPDRNGKMPGFAGTYGRAGWGGRPVDGTDGWSARGKWGETDDPEKTWIGYYVYHADMDGTYGDDFRPTQPDERNEASKVSHEEWHCVEQYIKLNTPGKNDGILRSWIDGTNTFEKTDIRFRDTDKLRIERYWANFYYGGKWTAPKDMNVYMDNLVISTSPENYLSAEN